MIIGVMGCIWGGLTFIYNGCCQILPSLGGKLAMNVMPPEAQDQMKAQMALIGPVDIGFMFLMTFVSILLLIAAITLLRRKPIAAQLHLAYGALAVVVLLAHIGWGVYRSGQIAQIMQQNVAASGANNPMAGLGTMSETASTPSGEIPGRGEGRVVIDMVVLGQTRCGKNVS